MRGRSALGAGEAINEQVSGSSLRRSAAPQRAQSTARERRARTSASRPRRVAGGSERYLSVLWQRGNLDARRGRSVTCECALSALSTSLAYRDRSDKQLEAACSLTGRYERAHVDDLARSSAPHAVL